MEASPFRPAFRPAAGPVLWFLIALAILLGLGFWQIGRHREKQALMAEARARLALPPVDLLEAVAEPEAFAWRRVHAEGIYAPQETVLLLDRRREGKGSLVITPLRVEGLHASDGGAAAILVVRGWIPSNAEETFLERDARRGPAEVLGSLLPLEDARAGPPPSRTRRRLLAFNFSALRAQVSMPLVPALLKRGDREDGDVPRGEWALPRARVDHKAYAWTWFLLAVTLVVVFTAASLRRRPR
jgi:surfeit locus 1 family protein